MNKNLVCVRYYDNRDKKIRKSGIAERYYDKDFVFRDLKTGTEYLYESTKELPKYITGRFAVWSDAELSGVSCIDKCVIRKLKYRRYGYNPDKEVYFKKSHNYEVAVERDNILRSVGILHFIAETGHPLEDFIHDGEIRVKATVYGVFKPISATTSYDHAWLCYKVLDMRGLKSCIAKLRLIV